jgi:catechol 2,3-dioxygenase-like lactoylglutathione lyase family enzyme
MDAMSYDWTRAIFDHVHLRVADLEASKQFYATVLAPLEIPLLLNTPHLLGFANLALSADKPPTQGAHIAFAADDRATVDAFHAAGVAAGYTDNGAPGVRPYGPPQLETYAAYLLDPDGTNVEAVARLPKAAG